MLDYVGRYTHRIAISNQRLLALAAGQVQFRYTDYRRPHAPGQKTMTLAATEFIRRVLLHVLPRGFPSVDALRAPTRDVENRCAVSHKRPQLSFVTITPERRNSLAT